MKLREKMLWRPRVRVPMMSSQRISMRPTGSSCKVAMSSTMASSAGR